MLTHSSSCIIVIATKTGGVILKSVKEKKKELLENFQVRKSRKQKEKFAERVKEQAVSEGYKFNIETTKGIIKSRNIVVGNVEKAKVVYTAHYDTCAWSPFPNMIWLKSPIMYLLYQALITCIILFVGFGASLLLAICVGTADYTQYVFSVTVLLLGIQLMFGFRNKKTANDNTSGVLTLLTIMEKIPVSMREDVAFVFFDNEEKGLIGSSAFYKKHKPDDKCLVNFDCVGEGDNIFFIHKKGADEKHIESLKNSFPTDKKYSQRVVKGGFFAFPSDQVHFKNGIGVSTAKKCKLGGYYVGRLHTGRDKVLEETNVLFLALWACDFAALIEKTN